MNTPHKDKKKPNSASAEAGYMLKPEVATMLRKTKKTVERWMARGIIPYIKIGKGKRATVLFKREAIETSLESNFGVGGCR